MKKIFVLLAIVLGMLGSVQDALAQDIRVGIVNGQRSVLFHVKAGELSVDGAGNAFATVETGTDLLISANEGNLHINGERLANADLFLRPADNTAEIEVNKRTYRGAFTVRLLAGGKSLTVVNRLPLEEYLYGTVAGEVQALWPEEAVKAQAIVIRSNAYNAIGKNLQKPYDILAMSGQSYYGRGAEREAVNAVVDMTEGLVVTYQSSAIEAPFFASSGGRTEEGSQPYLKSVSDYDQDSPDFAWERILTAEELDASIQYAGYDSIGSLRGFDFSPMDMSRLDSLPDRGKSGRLKQVRIIGERGFEVMSGEKFAKLLNLPSSAFDLAIDNVIPQSVDIPITDRYGNVIGYKKMPIEVNASVTFPKDRSYIQRVTWAENEKIIIRGHGSGSGLGFSQWGARGMALAGQSSEYILSYYFPGTTLRKVY